MDFQDNLDPAVGRQQAADVRDGS